MTVVPLPNSSSIILTFLGSLLCSTVIAVFVLSLSASDSLAAKPDIGYDIFEPDLTCSMSRLLGSPSLVNFVFDSVFFEIRLSFFLNVDVAAIVL